MRLRLVEIPTFAAILVLSACGNAPPEPSVERLPLLGGYRSPADECVRVGENGFTNQFLDDSADLVGCPVDYFGTTNFANETGAVRLTNAQGYVLFSVPRG